MDQGALRLIAGHCASLAAHTKKTIDTDILKWMEIAGELSVLCIYFVEK